jgi:hypothetical protein
MEVSSQLHAPVVLAREKSSRYPVNRRLGGPKGRAERYGENNFSPLPGTEFQLLGRPVRHLVTIPTELRISLILNTEFKLDVIEMSLYFLKTSVKMDGNKPDNFK